MDRTWIDPLTFALTYLGLGGALLALRLACGTSSLYGRTVSALLALLVGVGIVFAAVAAAAGQPAVLWQPPITLLALYVPLFVLPSPACRRLASAAANALQNATRSRPVRLGLATLAFLGLPTLGCTLLLWHYDAQVTYEDANRPQTILDTKLAMRKVDYPLTTDRGRRIQPLTCEGQDEALSVLRDQQAEHLQLYGLISSVMALEHGWQNCNCHGYVFTGGRFWVHGEQVPLILEDNGYTLVTDPRAGDLVVYRDGQSKVIHTGVVRGMADAGVILVESKWGNLGRFLHAHDKHIYLAAESCQYYRSPRAGHLLYGLNPDDSADPAPALLDEADAATSAQVGS